MKVVRKSELTGKIHAREIEISPQRLEAWDNDDPMTRPLIQKAFPDLDMDDREFILTGITPEEWDQLVG